MFSPPLSDLKKYKMIFERVETFQTTMEESHNKDTHNCHTFAPYKKFIS